LHIGQIYIQMLVSELLCVFYANNKDIEI